MATHVVTKYVLEKFWDDEFKTLDYIREPFNDPVAVTDWIRHGYSAPFTGEMCDMRHTLPSWNHKFIEVYESMGWKDVGVSYYRMRTGTVMPEHQDLYRRYVELFNLQGQEETISRALVLLEDWKPGHYLEVQGIPYVNWSAGQTVEWTYNTPHMAANIGLEDRYTLQITGHK
jgi:hypothetical protein